MKDKCPECGADLDKHYRDQVTKQLKEEHEKEKEELYLELNKKLDKTKLENLKLKADQEQNIEIIKAELKQQVSNEFSEERLEFQKQKIKLQGELSNLQKSKKTEIEIEVAKALQKQKSQLDTDHELKETEKDNEIYQLKKLISDLKDKSKQGSQQAQGEIGEIFIEKTLKVEFPMDVIQEVPKGQNGADISHHVKDRNNNDLGMIYIESKYAKKFSASWVEKLKEDMKNKKASFGIIVTLDVPENIDKYEEDDLFICGFNNYLLAVKLLRNHILQVEKNKNIEINKNSANRIYDYLTSKEFAQWARSMIDYFSEQKQQLEIDKNNSLKSFSIREKQIEKAMNSHKALTGNLIGIASRNEFVMLDEATDENLIEN